jgi:hypothetical protein
MKDLFSAFLAISVLSVGGLGLYIYNNRDATSSDNDESYDKSENYNENEEYNDEIFEEKPRVKKQKNKANTKRNKKTDGTKRRY